MIDSTRVWLAKLWAAFVAGGAATVSGTIALMIGDAKDSNLSSWSGVLHLLRLIGIMFFVHGLIDASGFLKTNPTPPGWVMVPEHRVIPEVPLVGGKRMEDPPIVVTVSQGKADLKTPEGIPIPIKKEGE